MNPEIKERWIAALESGEYAKGVSALKRIDTDGLCSFCCLGVIADIHGDLVEEAKYRIVTKKRSHSGWLLDGEYGLSKMVQRELGSINDKSDTFAPVIEYIRENL